MRRKTEFGTYLLTGKLVCGKCGALMTGISGVGRHGDRCFYYACVRKKNERACDKKNVRRDPVELAITTCLQQLLMDDDLIEWMAEQATAYQNTNRDVDEYDTIARKLRETAEKRKNIMAAIEAGIFTASTKDRLEELEREEEQLKVQLAVIKKELEDAITKEMIISYLESLRDGDVNNKKFQQLMIDSFLGKAIIYDDRIKLLFDITKEHREVTIPFEIEGKGGDGTEASEGLFKLCTTPQLCLKQTPVYFIKGMFMVELPFAG